ncbi:MAG TPA: DUF1499 domain-containing protein [Thermoanaerobaculia bacterium]|nr:DUF1499 domain-containing protein [Thermoanaerobaculia bacterium]
MTPSARSTPQRTLRPCPKTPNCVSTQSADAKHRMEPLPYADLEEARARLLAILAGKANAKVVTVEPTYVHAEFRSALFRFVDDVELLFDETARRLHFRSASRVGRSDFGVNRKRMEEIAREFRERAPGRQ